MNPADPADKETDMPATITGALAAISQRLLPAQPETETTARCGWCGRTGSKSGMTEDRDPVPEGSLVPAAVTWVCGREPLREIPGALPLGGSLLAPDPAGFPAYQAEIAACLQRGTDARAAAQVSTDAPAQPGTLPDAPGQAETPRDAVAQDETAGTGNEPEAAPENAEDRS